MATTDDILRELRTNMSWYNLNTNYNNTMLRYMANISTQIIIKTAVRTNFVMIVGNSFVIDNSPIVKYGSIPCSAPGKEAYMDSELSCALFQLPYFLEKIEFGYLCSIVILPIMLISIFGKIKESYRWFLLNQAIWDVFMCCSFICEKPSVLAWTSTSYKEYATCFYLQQTSNPFLTTFFTVLRNSSFRSAPYIPLFLLAFSRCISLYFPNFYQRNNQTWKILFFIIFVDIFMMFLSSLSTFLLNTVNFIKDISFQNCFNTFCLENFKNYTSESLDCFIQNEKHYQCKNRANVFYNNFIIPSRYSSISVSPFFFLLVLICVFLLIFKISLQLKYQLKHNRYSFLKTLKVVSIIFIQSISLTILLLITSLQSYLQHLSLGEFYTETTIYQKLSPTIFLLQSFATTTSINIIRIFFDSFIVLTVLSGYRKRIFRFFAFLITFAKKTFCKNNVVSTATVITKNSIKKSTIKTPLKMMSSSQMRHCGEKVMNSF